METKRWYKVSSLLLVLLLALTLSACNNKLGQKKISLSINETDFTFMNWQVDNSHTAHVVGKMVAENQPIEGVKIQINDKRIMTTNEKGEFYFTVNRNILQKINLHVANTDAAKIQGKTIDSSTKKSILAIKKEITVKYPIKIEKISVNKQNKNLVDVYGRAIVKKGEAYPNFTADKYKVSGKVMDADGNPVQGATVNLRRDGVEGFSMSTPSDIDGVYTMYYLPEEDENHYFYVHYNGKNYTLPQYKVYNFPDSVSVNIDVTLPKEGTIIVDKPPTLVTTTAPGAFYKGTLIGVKVDKNIPYSISIPKLDGSFVLTMPKEEWDKHPRFFEVSYANFLEEGKKPGDVINSSFIPEPKGTEPNDIRVTQ